MIPLKPPITILIVSLSAVPIGDLGAAWAQGTPPPAVSEDSVAPPRAAAGVGPAVVKAADIGIAAGRTVAAVRALSTDFARSPRIAEIERAVPRVTAEIAALRGATQVSGLDAQSIDELEDLESQWNDVSATLGRWQDQLRRRADALAGSRDSLDRMRRVWELTRDASDAERLLPPLAGRVADVLGEIGHAETVLRERLDAVLTLQSRVADVSLEVGEIQAQVSRARLEAGRRLLTAERPPLWRELAAPPDTVAAAGRMRDLGMARRRAVLDYLRARTANLLGLAVVFLGVTLALSEFRRRPRASGTDASGGLGFLVQRPISAGLTVAILLTPVVLPRSPVLLVSGVLLLALPPLARLVPGTAPAAWRRPMLGTLAVTFLVLLTGLTQGYPRLERVAVIGVSLLALAAAVLLLRRFHPAPADGRYAWVVRTFLALGATLLGLAAVVNTAGYVSLGVLLLRATALSGTAAVAFFVGSRAAAGLAGAVIRQGLAHVLSAVHARQDSLVRRTGRLLHVAAGLGWVWVTLRAFRVLDEVLGALWATLTARLAVGTVNTSLGDVLLFGLVLWLAVLVSRAIRFLLEDDVLPRMALPRGMPATVSTLVYYVALMLGFVFAVGAAGFDLSRLTLLAGAFGIGIGFGLQNIVNNFVSGLILKFERPIALGDVIELDTMMGAMQRIGIRSSTIRTFSGAEVIVPNADLVAGRVVNWTLSDRRRRLEIPVGVAYGSNPRQVLDLLRTVASQHPRVLGDPAPSALFKGFGESSLDFVLRCWTGDFDEWVVVTSEVTTAVYEALGAAGIEIPFPQRDLHLRSVSPAAGASLRSPATPPI